MQPQQRQRQRQQQQQTIATQNLNQHGQSTLMLCYYYGHSNIDPIISNHQDRFKL